MGRQVRKIHAWSGSFNSHALHNHHFHKMVRWQSYQSNPTLTTGKPFKTRGGRRPPIGILLTPDVLKFHVPTKYSFVPVDPNETYDAKTAPPKVEAVVLKDPTDYLNNISCNTYVNNLNNCLINNGTKSCTFYDDYLTRNCMRI